MNWIELPLPPSGNNLFLNIRGRGRIRAPKYEAWRTLAALAVKASDHKPVAGPYALHVNAGRPDRRRRDLDNLLKAISDSLKSCGVVQDDSMCMSIDAKWVPGIVGAHVLVLPTNEVAR